MGLAFLTPLFLAGFLAIAVPVIVHLIRKHRGRSLDFPSLMFLRKLPTNSVKRLRIRDWPLLLLRAAALALIILAFARPVLQLGTTDETGEGDGLRDVVIALDRSWSMARGDRWDRAVEEARSVLAELVTPDRVSLVIFDQSGSIAVEPTLNPASISAVLDTLEAGWAGTRYGSAIQVAGGILEGSERSRREVVMISDFRLRGWEGDSHDQLPRGTRLIPVNVGDDELGSLIVSEVMLDHSFFEGRQRVHTQARVIRSGAGAPSQATLILEMDGREIESRTVDLPTEGAVAIPFDPVTLPDDGVRGALRLIPDGAPPEEPFRFYFSAQQVLSILLVEGTGAAANPFLRSALSIGGGQPVQLQRRTGEQLTAPDLQGVNLVVFNDLPLPSGASGSLLREHVLQGGGLLVVAGPGSAPATWDAEWDALLPGRPGNAVDRNPVRGGSLSRIDRDHPIFSTFTGQSGSALGGPRFFRYRSLALPSPEEVGEVEPLAEDLRPRVLASFDDGAPALAERPAGRGRVLVWTSSLDNSWSDFPLHPIFLPVVREIARHTASQQETVPYFTVGQPLDAGFLLSTAGVQAEPPAPSGPDASAGTASGPIGILVGPDGVGTEVGGTGRTLVQLHTPGFYELRFEANGVQGERVFAVNPDVSEADPTPMDPEDFVLAVAPGSGGDIEGEEFAATSLSGTQSQGATGFLQEGERRQGAWRFLLMGALLLLVAEAVLAARSQPLNRAS